MTGSTSTTQAPATGEATPYVEKSKTVKFNGADLVITTIPPKQRIEDGQHFLSANDRHCFMLPRADYDRAVKYANENVVAEATKAWTVDQLKAAITWARQRIADKNNHPDMYLVMPVSREKKNDALGMYMSSLWALRKGCEAELGRRDGDFFVEATKRPTPAAVSEPAPEAAAPAAESADPLSALTQG
jgi:hypothetical protein